MKSYYSDVSYRLGCRASPYADSVGHCSTCFTSEECFRYTDEEAETLMRAIEKRFTQVKSVRASQFAQYPSLVVEFNSLSCGDRLVREILQFITQNWKYPHRVKVFSKTLEKIIYD